jgi:hypothetical protein
MNEPGMRGLPNRPVREQGAPRKLHTKWGILILISLPKQRHRVRLV